MDRRARRRISVSSPATIEFGSELMIPGLATELTTSGASVSINRQLPPDANNLLLNVLNTQIPIERIWAQSEPSESLHSYGVMFQELRKSQFQAIQRFLDKRPSTDERRRGDRRLTRSAVDETRRTSDRRKDFFTFHCFINGRSVPTSDFLYFPKVESLLLHPDETRKILRKLRGGIPPPADRDLIYACCSQGNVNVFKDAIDSAHAAFPKMKSLSLSTRIQILQDIRKSLLKNRDTMIQLFEYEGHPRKLAEWEFSGMVEGLSEETLRFFKKEMLVRPNGSTKVMLARKPDGVVCVSPPGNAPASNSLTACLAFLGGNCVIVKPPRTQPISTVYLWKKIIYGALEMNGAPKGAVNIVIGHYQDVYKTWFEDKRVKDIIYFGTSERGIEVGRQAFAHNKKAILELSGKDPLIVWKDADLAKASQSLCDGYLGSTQICMVPKIAFIHDEAFDQFRDTFVNDVKKILPTLPSDEEGILSPVIKIQEFMKFLQDAVANGGKLLLGGERLDHKGVRDSRGLFLQPTVIEFDGENPRLLDILCISQENFFPIIPLVRISGVKLNSTALRDNSIFEKMVNFVNNNQFGLRVSAWAKSPTFLRKFIRAADNSGLLLINQRHVGFSPYLATHGGLNRTGGPYGELNYIWQKTTHLQGISLKR